MRLKIVLLAALGLLAVAGVAQAAGLFGHSTPQSSLQQREQALMRKVEGQGQGHGQASISRVRRGPRGPRGFHGPKGATGPAGTFGAVTPATGNATVLCSTEASCQVGTAAVECPPGTKVTGGGYTGGGIETIITWSAPVGNGWTVIAVNYYGTASVKAVALCAS
jgi:hypothetical protein